MSEGGIWAEFFVRAFATGLVVVFIAWAAARLGPAIGGVLVGLPIVLAPGFFFLVRDQPPPFVAAAAAAALFSLVATQAFLGAYVAAAPRLPAMAATLAAILAWCFVALPLAFAPHPPWAGAGLFVLATLAARLVGRRFMKPLPAAVPVTRWGLLVLRGVAAGLLVGMVTLAASALGPSLAGMLAAFPVGFCVVLLSLSVDHGEAVAARTAYAGLAGVSSLAAFCLVLALATGALSPWTAYLCALAASLVVTAAASLFARGSRAGGGRLP